MKKICLSLLMSVPLVSMAQNPIIRDQFTADPTARVFNNKVYLYPSHDIVPPAGQRQDWFCMEDYHVFSSENLTDWTDHGVIVTQNKVPWVKPNSYSMWAPDCVYKDGKYYFYFPSNPASGMGFGIGVAVDSGICVGFVVGVTFWLTTVFSVLSFWLLGVGNSLFFPEHPVRLLIINTITSKADMQICTLHFCFFIKTLPFLNIYVFLQIFTQFSLTTLTMSIISYYFSTLCSIQISL